MSFASCFCLAVLKLCDETKTFKNSLNTVIQIKIQSYIMEKKPFSIILKYKITPLPDTLYH